MIFKDCFFSIGGNDLSEDVREVSLDLGREGQDDTTMGDDARTSESGLETWSGSVTFKQDFDSGKVDEILYNIYKSDTGTAPIEIRPKTAAVSVNNAKWTATARLASYSPFGQSVGDLATAPLSLEAASPIVRATS